MEQKDYLLREIEKMGTLLRYMMGKIKQKSTIDESFISSELSKNFYAQTGWDFGSLLNESKSVIEEKLSKGKGFDAANIEMLADIFATIGSKGSYMRNEYLNKAIELYQFIDEQTKVFSFDRIEKIESIKKMRRK